MFGVSTDPTFSALFMRHDLMIEVGRLEKTIGNDVSVPSGAASPAAPLESGTQESARS